MGRIQQSSYGWAGTSLRYLGRYTHRIAIGNERLVSLHEGNVTFRYKDRAHGNQAELMTLPAPEFVRRFLIHVVPKRFVRIRHYGLLANGIKSDRLEKARLLLQIPVPLAPSSDQTETRDDLYRRLTGSEPWLCPVCRVGKLQVVAELPRSAPTTMRGP